MVTPSLHNYRQSPRKVRLVATLIKGKTVDQALNMLGVTVKRASDPIAKLLLSAVANAKDRNVNTDGFVVLECTVNQGYTMRRMMPGARGSGFPIRKKTSHVKLVIGPKASKKAAKAAPVEKAAKTTK